MKTTRTLQLLIGITVVGFTLAVAPPAFAKHHHDKEGTFQSMLDHGADCASPLHICTNGSLSGDIEATYHFEVDTMTPDANNPHMSHFTGHTVITGKKGAQMFSHDTGTITFISQTVALLAEDIGIDGGTKKYEEASGVLSCNGSIDFSTGLGGGSYAGTLEND